MVFTVVTFVAFTALVAVLSWWKTKDDDLSTKEGYFLAGRGLPGIVIAGSLMMTNLSAEQLVGTNGQSFAGNMSTMAWEATSAFALIALAFVFLPKLLRGGIATIPEFLEMRYDTFTMRLFSILFLIAYVVTMLPTILYSGAVALVKIFDLEAMFGIDYFTAIAIICVGTGVVGMCYAVFGGLKAVAYSDTINGVGLIIGGFAIPILGILALGQLDGGGFLEGVKHLITATPEKMNAWSEPSALPPEVPWPLLFTGMFVNNLFYWATNQSIIQRSLGGKNLAESQKGAIWAGFFKCLDVFVIVLPGIIAFQLLAMNGQMDTSVGMAADQAYPLLVMKVLPKPLMGFFAAVMFGAILSSFNSVLNSASTIFTLNIWQPIWGKTANNQKVVKVGQIFGTVVGVVSIVISPFVMYFGTGIMNFINECWGFFSMPLLTAVLFGLLSKRAPSIAPKIIIPLHMVLYGLSKVIPFFSQFHYLYVVFALFVLECLIYAVCIKVCPRKTEWEMPDAKVMDMTSWKTGKRWAIVGAGVVVVMYVICSPLGIGA
ncbi:solute:sodium symporter family transporter [Agathobaculum sp. Marseille-P7918]|uniref:solute:sodium symporter family transporter n=1 Tax=Agathobaculum sp. Marseille-P7918 TaxID=2479843 RepID=UPI000F62D7DA|nr:solute:sodium symporter family transporter [Agathobaculum sp. Marseille-P7918]